MVAVGMNTPVAAVDFAEDTSGLYPGLCDRFVASAYQVNIDAAGTPHSGYDNAWTHWNQTPAKMRNPGKGKPPIGALVYWNNSVGDGHGHVAIVTGVDKNGEAIITSTHANGGRPTEFALSSVMPSAYLGWATPYFQGKTAKLDKTNLDRAVSGVAQTGSGDETANTSGQVQDKLTNREAYAQEGFSWDFVKSHSEVRGVFDLAIEQDWLNSGQVGKDKFINAIQATTWAKNNSSFAQDYILNKAKGGETWEEQKRVAADMVRREAKRIGAKLDDTQLSFFADQTLMNGWNVDGRQSFLTQALTGQLSYKDSAGKQHDFKTDFLNYSSGTVQNTITELKNLAFKQGLTYDDGWYQAAARAVQSELGSIEDYKNEINTLAATNHPIWSDKIKAGATAFDLGSPYMGRIDAKLGRTAGTTKMDDPYMKMALGNVNDKGEHTPMGLWDLDKALMRTEEWAGTKEAHDKVSSLTQRITSMFGFGG